MAFCATAGFGFGLGADGDTDTAKGGDTLVVSDRSGGGGFGFLGAAAGLLSGGEPTLVETAGGTGGSALLASRVEGLGDKRTLGLGATGGPPSACNKRGISL